MSKEILPKIMIKLNAIDAKIGNTLLQYLEREFPTVTYPERMQNCITLIRTHNYMFVSTPVKLKSLVLESMARHIHSHNEKRLKQYIKETEKYMDSNNNLVPINKIIELKFICHNWNQLWNMPL